MALPKTATWTASSTMRSWSKSSSPLAEDSGRLESVKREAQGCCSWRPRGTSQDGPSPDLSSSIKKTQWVGWTVNSTEWRSIKKWLPEACDADFLLAQETHQGRSGCRGGLDAIERMAVKRGGHGCSSAAAWSGDAARWCWRQGHRAVQGACARVLPQRHCARRRTDSLSLRAHRSRSHPGKLPNPQHHWPVLTSQAVPFIIGGDFQVEAK